MHLYKEYAGKCKLQMYNAKYKLKYFLSAREKSFELLTENVTCNAKLFNCSPLHTNTHSLHAIIPLCF